MDIFNQKEVIFGTSFRAIGILSRSSLAHLILISRLEAIRRKLVGIRDTEGDQIDTVVSLWEDLVWKAMQFEMRPSH